MRFELDTDTTLAPLEGGRYAATLTDRWDVGAAPNGGYVMALLLRALQAELGERDVTTATAHFLRPATPGHVELEVEALRTGRTLATGMVSLRAGGAEAARMIASLGVHTAAQEPRYDATEPPDLPSPEDCLSARGPTPGGTLSEIVERLEVRLAPWTVGWARGAPTGRPEIGGWFRLADGREPDLLALAVAIDAFAPTVFELGAVGWVPTVELTLHARHRPAPGWLRVWVRSRYVAGGYVEEDADVWDSQGRLVAMGRQLALIPRDRTG